jgi:hypothetical protein
MCMAGAQNYSPTMGSGTKPEIAISTQRTKPSDFPMTRVSDGAARHDLFERLRDLDWQRSKPCGPMR